MEKWKKNIGDRTQGVSTPEGEAQGGIKEKVEAGFKATVVALFGVVS